MAKRKTAKKPTSTSDSKKAVLTSWDCDVWNAVAAGLHPFSGLLKEFKGLAAERCRGGSGRRRCLLSWVTPVAANFTDFS